MKKIHILGIVVIALAIAAIITTVSDSSTYATFKEAAENSSNEFHVVGTLNKTKPVEYNPEQNANLFTFYMIDKEGNEKKVLFNGSKPQDFERSEQIVITGQCSTGDFKASKILMKCPSKYNNGSDTQVLEAKANT